MNARSLLICQLAITSLLNTSSSSIGTHRLLSCLPSPLIVLVPLASEYLSTENVYRSIILTVRNGHPGHIAFISSKRIQHFPTNANLTILKTDDHVLFSVMWLHKQLEEGMKRHSMICKGRPNAQAVDVIHDAAVNPVVVDPLLVRLLIFFRYLFQGLYYCLCKDTIHEVDDDDSRSGALEFNDGTLPLLDFHLGLQLLQ